MLVTAACSPRVEAGVALVGLIATRCQVHARCASEPGLGGVALDETDVAVKGVGVRIRSHFDTTDAGAASRRH